MDRQQIEAEHIIPRYLSGALSEEENEEFDKFAAEHPEIYREVENVLRMKEALARLHERGELKPLLQQKSRRFLTPALAAAAVLVLSVGIWSTFWYKPATILARTPSEFAGAPSGGLPLVGRYDLVLSRATAAPVELRLPAARGLLQLRVLPSMFTPEASYRARLERVDPGKTATPVRELGGLQVGTDRYVRLYVDSAGIVPGDYELTLIPEDNTSKGDLAERFAIRAIRF